MAQTVNKHRKIVACWVNSAHLGEVSSAIIGARIYVFFKSEA